jgi:hypothetical protein
MGNWGKTYDPSTLRPEHPLMRATRALSVDTRAKIYAVITRGEVMHKGTWDGCVFNKITNMNNARSVASLLGEDEQKVMNFITAWDGLPLNDIRATVFLSKLLEQVGIVKEAPVHDDRKIVKVRLHTSEETKAVEELRAEIDNGAFDELLSQVDELVGAC